MSLDALMTQTGTVYRKAITKDISGGQVENFAAVATLTDLPCSVQPVRGNAMYFQGQRQVVISHNVYFADAWDIRRGDKLIVTSNDGRADQTFLVRGFMNLAGRDYVYKSECTEET